MRDGVVAHLRYGTIHDGQKSMLRATVPNPTAKEQYVILDVLMSPQKTFKGGSKFGPLSILSPFEALQKLVNSVEVEVGAPTLHKAAEEVELWLGHMGVM